MIFKAKKKLQCQNLKSVLKLGALDKKFKKNVWDYKICFFFDNKNKLFY